MTLALASLKEGSEESRQKRAVRRYLNKKKQRPEPVEEAVIDEGSEEARLARQKRIAQKKKDKKPIEEAVIPGSLNHMMHELHNHHAHGLESPHYYIHPVGRSYAPSGGNSSDTHHYAVVSRNSIHDDTGTHYPSHTFNLWHEGGKYHVTHRAKVE
jgi:hypothetical protein